MADLLSGLEAFGLGGVKGKDLFDNKNSEKQKKVEEVAKEPVKKEKPLEKDALFDKGYMCPVCENSFKSKTVRTGRTRVNGMDIDLRPIYDPVDALKYDAVMCPHCGYSALSKYFPNLTSMQRKMIKAQIAENYHKKEDSLGLEIYSYDDAIERHKMALASAIVKKGPASEKAFICLKGAWLTRGKMENLDQSAPDFQDVFEECQEQEEEFLKNAYEGFTTARSNEMPPICGMDMQTLEYVLAVYAMRFGDNEVAARYISGILISTTANSRLKDKARDLKAMLIEKLKNS